MARRLIVVLATLFVSSLSGQTDRGAIKGTVVDPSGAGVPIAAVEARNQNTSIVVRELTNAHGGFTFSTLRPGEYEVTAELAGFKRR
jgi:protocatechuate 3,4-dioxygenase beta subunit